MSKAKQVMDDGGPAFPHDADYARGDTKGSYVFQEHFDPGMSLRAYLVAHAPQRPAWFFGDDETDTSKDDMLDWPVWWADEMITRLKP